MKYCYGRLPALRPAALGDLSVYANGRLPTPPRTVEVPQGPYPIDGNDRLGDCTLAGVDHLLRAWDREFRESDPPIAEDVIEALYFQLTGGEDTGLNEAEVLKEWH